MMLQFLHSSTHTNTLLYMVFSSFHQPSVEELLAIMEGSSVNPAAQTLHHIQKINAHLSSLALHAPVTVSANKPRKSSADMREERRVQRLMSEPGMYPRFYLKSRKGKYVGYKLFFWCFLKFPSVLI